MIYEIASFTSSESWMSFGNVLLKTLVEMFPSLHKKKNPKLWNARHTTIKADISDSQEKAHMEGKPTYLTVRT
jgi:hypothetical protein